tara:strand:- start:800 stop:1168 length:369 start_codon:yes stop_codon:yes gene_type:complete
MNYKLDNAYKTIGEVAKILDLKNEKNGKLATHTIRFWENQFKQIRPKIFNGKRRYYDTRTIETLKKIKFLLKDRGMTIQGVKKTLNSLNRTVDERENLSINAKNKLKSKLNKISLLIKELKN